MAKRRMFSPEIVSSDAFLDMPISTQALYFQLGMNADDDGFVNPRRIMKMTGSSDDDLRMLLGKRFLLPFASGVVVIKHWLIHNLIRADLYTETLYKKEKSELGLNENGAYTELREGIFELKKIEAPKWLKIRRKELRTANVPQTALRLGKDRIDIHASPSARVPLKDNKNNMQKYQESRHSSDDEPIIDMDTGEVTRTRKNVSKSMKELLEWSEKRSGRTFVNVGKQYKAMALMRRANKSPSDIMNRWAELERDNFYQNKGFDFMDIASSFDKK